MSSHRNPLIETAPQQPQDGGGAFPSTQWSIISMARGSDTVGLRKLASNYWRPLYLYLRKRGEGHEDASDAVQGFFEFVFSSGFFEHVEREGGKFRSYLLTSMERWRTRQRTRNLAQKRGGNVLHVAMEDMGALAEIAGVSDDSVSPELAYDRQWANELVLRTVQAIREDYVKRNREQWFAKLAGALPGGGGLATYRELAVELETSENAVKKAVFDLRQAFGARLREEIRATVRTNEEAEEELRYLVSIFAAN